MLSAFPCVSLRSLWQRPVIQRAPSCSRAVFTPSSDFSSDLWLILPLFPKTLVPNRGSAPSFFNTSPNIIPKMSQNDCTWKLNVYFKMEIANKTENTEFLRPVTGLCRCHLWSRCPLVPEPNNQYVGQHEFYCFPDWNSTVPRWTCDTLLFLSY